MTDNEKAYKELFTAMNECDFLLWDFQAIESTLRDVMIRFEDAIKDEHAAMPEGHTILNEMWVTVNFYSECLKTFERQQKAIESVTATLKHVNKEVKPGS